MYVGQYPHGLYALPSLVDELTTTYASPYTGPLLLEGPSASSVEASEDLASVGPRSPVSVNLRLPTDLKMEWMEQYHNNMGSANKPPIILFGEIIVLNPYCVISGTKINQFVRPSGHYRVPEITPARVAPNIQVSGEESTASIPEGQGKTSSPQMQDGHQNRWFYALGLILFLVLPGLLILYQKLSVSVIEVHSSSNSSKRDPVQYSPAIELDSGFVQVRLNYILCLVTDD